MDKREFIPMYSQVCALLASIVLVAAIKPNFSEDVVADQGSFSSSAGSETSPPFMSASDGVIPTPHNSPDFQTCASSTEYAGQLFVFSTLDGQINAIGRKGNVHWSVNTNPGPLISSSIQNLQFSNKDGQYKIVPMLDGSLFKWDGDCLEGIPFNAESLLSASFKLSEDITVVGGKEKMTYGINAHTGKIRYTCSSFGCQMIGNDSDDVTDDEDLIVVERKQHTIRAVEQRTGMEKWNFSVGQHELSFLGGNFLHNDDLHMDDDAENTCGEGMEQELAYDNPILHMSVSSGRVYAFSRSDPTHLLWSHKFSSAISQAWSLQDGEFDQIDLFDGNNIPAIAYEHNNFLPPQVQPQPMMYLGTYKNQLYAQSSELFQEELSFVANAFAYARPDNDGLMDRVLWRPYQSTAQFRTPIILHEQDHELLDREGDQTGDPSRISWNDYPFDMGYYLFRSQTPAQYTISQRNPRLLIETETKVAGDGLDNVIVASLWNWWKEILATSFLISVLMQLFHSQFKRIAKARKDSTSRCSSEGDAVEELDVAEEVQANPLVPDSPTLVYTSRYLIDFEHQACLGKGGFGIVFQAKNKVDENEYAVKRTTLPNRLEARQKVLREARFLAKLDHVGIVRYFNSWLEEPPLGWQEEKDLEIGLESGITDTVATGFTIQSFSPDSNLLRDEDQFHRQTSSDNLFAKAREDSSPIPGCHGDDNTTTDDTSGTNGFNIGEYEEESGSFSIILQEELQDDSAGDLQNRSVGFEVSFQKSDQSEDNDNTPSVPFQNYGEESLGFNADTEDNSASFQVVFEDSGCAEKGSDQTGESGGTGSHQTITKEHSEKCSTTSSSRSKKSEAREIRKLERRSIAKVYLYIQMQLCQKETLKDWLSKNTLNRNRNRVLHMYDQIVQAMHYVHGLGLIHRDLKPSNIFFAIDNTIKIGDFGLVTAIDTQVLNVATPTTTEEENRAFGDQRHTSQVGTHLYMSPEQLEGKTYGSKVDIFSLGLIFFEMLFPFSTEMERIKVMSNAKKCSLPKRFTDELPTETKFVTWLLSREPDERPDANEIMESNLFANVFEDYTPPHPVIRKRFSSNTATS